MSWDSSLVIRGTSAEVELDPKALAILKEIATYMFHRGLRGRHHARVKFDYNSYQYDLDPEAFLSSIEPTRFNHSAMGLRHALVACRMYLGWITGYATVMRVQSPQESMVAQELAVDLDNHMTEYMCPRLDALKQRYIEELKGLSKTEEDCISLVAHIQFLEKRYLTNTLGRIHSGRVDYGNLVTILASAYQKVAILRELKLLEEERAIDRLRKPT
jgi:hypothetical protein